MKTPARVARLSPAQAFRHSCVFTLLWAVILVSSCSKGSDRKFSPYSDFQNMSPEESSGLQIKLCFVGMGIPGGESPIITLAGNSPDTSLFAPYRRPEIAYVSDYSFYGIPVSMVELEAIIDSVATVRAITAGRVDAGEAVAFTMLSSSRITRAFDATLKIETADTLMMKIRSALRSNVNALVLLDYFGCPYGLTDTLHPTEATSLVKVVTSEMHSVPMPDHLADYYDPPGEVFECEALVTNVSQVPIAGPVSLMIYYEEPGFEFLNGTSTGCETSANAYVNLDLPDGSLLPGGSARQTLQFLASDGNPVVFSTRVFAGPGGR